MTKSIPDALKLGYPMSIPLSSTTKAELDPITGLINGNEMMLLIRDYINWFHRKGGFSPKLIFLDIDRFSGLALTLGEEGSRELLRAYCARLSEAVGGDGVIARGSGDRFFVLYGDVIVRKRLDGLFDTPLMVEGRPVYTPTSGGAVSYPDDADGPHQLVRCASMAMQWAKRIAPGTIIDFQAQMRDKAARARLIEDRMRDVIANPGQEFRLLYQPKTDFETGKIVGVEALMRWDSPTLGPIDPEEFIPVAEATRLIIPLGRWLIDSAFKVLQNWNSGGHRLEMAINTSPVELKSASFVPFLEEKINFYGLKQSMVEIEITESHLDTTFIVEEVIRLRRLGYRVAIDDFGRDQSNLSRVASLPATTLKIDKSLTDGILDDERQLALMRNILSLATDLGLRSVVEGVESQAQAEQIGGIGANYCQGFFKSKPLEADQITKFFDDNVQ